MLVSPEVVRVLYEPLGVSPAWHQVAAVLRRGTVRPCAALPPRCPEIAVIYIHHVDASVIRVFLLYHGVVLLAPNVFAFSVGRVCPRIRILLIILILLEEHHTLFSSGDHHLFVVRAFRRRVLLSIGSRLDVVLMGQPIRGDGSFGGVLNG